MAVIVEHIKVVLQRYDYTNSTWANVDELGDADVISASCRKQCCPDGAFAIGGVYAAVLSLVCRVPGLSYFGMKQCRMKVSHQYGSAPFTDIGTFYVLDVQKHGEIFSVSAQDAVGWTDVSSLNGTGSDPTDGETKYCVGAFMFAEQQQHNMLQLDATMERLTAVTNRFLQAQCGIADLLEWALYDVQANNGYDYTNATTYDGSGQPLNPAYFMLYVENNDLKNLEPRAWTDSPRDYYRFLSELACGFVHAREDGKLALGQFGQPEYGTAVIYENEVEFDFCEIADYDIQLLRATATAETNSLWYTSCMYNKSPGYNDHAYIRLTVENNPFLDGFLSAWNEGTGSIALGLWQQLSKYGGGYKIRPFRCTVHKAADYHLGQRIRFDFLPHDDRKDESIITSIQWTFRGGWKLACGGEDGRTMLDCLRVSKSDRVARDLQNSVTSLRGR